MEKKYFNVFVYLHTLIPLSCIVTLTILLQFRHLCRIRCIWYCYYYYHFIFFSFKLNKLHINNMMLINLLTICRYAYYNLSEVISNELPVIKLTLLKCPLCVSITILCNICWYLCKISYKNMQDILMKL